MNTDKNSMSFDFFLLTSSRKYLAIVSAFLVLFYGQMPVLATGGFDVNERTKPEFDIIIAKPKDGHAR